MKAIVADAAGAGVLRDKDGNDHQLDADTWTECDARDTIYTGEGQTAWVRYRKDGHQLEVHPNSMRISNKPKCCEQRAASVRRS